MEPILHAYFKEGKEASVIMWDTIEDTLTDLLTQAGELWTRFQLYLAR